MKKENREKLIYLAKCLEKAERMGCEKDEPEGARFIWVSHTMADEMSQAMRKIVKHEGGL